MFGALAEASDGGTLLKIYALAPQVNCSRLTPESQRNRSSVGINSAIRRLLVTLDRCRVSHGRNPWRFEGAHSSL